MPFSVSHFSNTTGDSNTATGSIALSTNTTGVRNTANGYAALNSNTTGERNTATGRAAMVNNTTGNNNTADGHDALFSNTTAIRNTASGSFALFSNTTGPNNTALGYFALFSNTTGNSNTAAGYDALLNNTTGVGNIALGNFAGSNLTTGDNNIDIGNVGIADEANTIRIGTVGTQTAIYVAGIMGKTVPMSTPVFVNANGQLGTVAEEVEKVNPDLVVRDANGKVYSVRYEAVNAMLLNEFLKEHRTVQEQKATIAQLKQDFQSRLAEQQKQIEALSAGFQKVTARIEMSKSAPQVAVNDQ